MCMESISPFSEDIELTAHFLYILLLYLWHFVVYGLLLPVAWVTCVTIDWLTHIGHIGRIVFGHVNDVDSDAIRESLKRAKMVEIIARGVESDIWDQLKLLQIVRHFRLER